MEINCIKIADSILAKVKENIEKHRKNNIVPHLVIVKNNEDQASNKYVAIKIKKAEEIGVKTTIIDNFKSEDELIEIIKDLNNDLNVHGYIVQLPLPKNFNTKKIFEYIDVKKDVDGLSQNAVYRNINDSNIFYPKACTANGIMQILKDINCNLSGKNVVIINRSAIVGKPLMGLMLQEDATVTICHSKTTNLKNHTLNADILIVAIGKPFFITSDMVKENAIVIDAGISVIDKKVVGDVHKDVYQKVKYITPVPNGVGKLTVAMIFKNLLDLMEENV